MMNEENELLRRYVQENSESAFAELVHKHIDLVYFATLEPDNLRAAEIDPRLAQSDRVGWYEVGDLAQLGASDEIQAWAARALDVNPQRRSRHIILDDASQRRLADDEWYDFSSAHPRLLNGCAAKHVSAANFEIERNDRQARRRQPDPKPAEARVVRPPFEGDGSRQRWRRCGRCDDPREDGGRKRKSTASSVVPGEPHIPIRPCGECGVELTQPLLWQVEQRALGRE